MSVAVEIYRADVMLIFMDDWGNSLKHLHKVSDNPRLMFPDNDCACRVPVVDQHLAMLNLRRPDIITNLIGDIDDGKIAASV